MSAEALVGAALCGVSGWTLGQLAGAAVVAVRRGVRWASFSLVGRNGAAGGNGATVGASTAACPWCVPCACRLTADGPSSTTTESVSTEIFHTDARSAS